MHLKIAVNIINLGVRICEVQIKGIRISEGPLYYLCVVAGKVSRVTSICSLSVWSVRSEDRTVR